MKTHIIGPRTAGRPFSPARPAARRPIRWERRLLKPAGVLTAARRVGVTFEPRFKLTPANFAAFQKAVAKLEDSSLHYPLIIVGANSIVGQASGQAIFELPEYMDMGKALDESIAILCWRLEDSEIKEPYDAKAAHARFAEKTWRDNWAQARDAAAAVEDGMQVQMKVGNEQLTAIGEQGPVFIHLLGESGKPMSLPWTTFYIKQTQLGEDPALAQSQMPGATGFNYLMLGKKPISGNHPLIDTLFPKESYPNRDIVERAEIHHLLAVLPYPEGLGALEFALAIPRLETTSLLEVITGEGWHTGNGQFQLPGAKDQLAGITVPTGGNHVSFFKAQDGGAISARRADQAEAIGDIVSKRIIIALKPAVSPSEADKAKLLLRIDELMSHEESKLGDLFVDADAKTLTKLVDQGILTQTQFEKLGSLIAVARHRKAEALRREQSLGFFGDSFGGGLLKGGGGQLRGGGLHTGVGRHAGSLGISRQSYEPNPFIPPTIYVIYPYGVAASADLQPDIEAGVALANNVISFGR